MKVGILLFVLIGAITTARASCLPNTYCSFFGERAARALDRQQATIEELRERAEDESGVPSNYYRNYHRPVEDQYDRDYREWRDRNAKTPGNNGNAGH